MAVRYLDGKKPRFWLNMYGRILLATLNVIVPVTDVKFVKYFQKLNDPKKTPDTVQIKLCREVKPRGSCEKFGMIFVALARL